MIITIKSRGAKVKALENNLISEDSKKSSYRIKPSELSSALQQIYTETGIWKVKLIVEDKTEVGIKKETQLECLEQLTSKHLHILEKEKDIKKFFKAVGFKDEGNILYNLYVVMTELDAEFVEKVKKDGHGSMASIYAKAFRMCYALPKNVEVSPEYSILMNSIATWMKKNCKEYKKNIGYNIFLKLLLKHTGYKVY